MGFNLEDLKMTSGSQTENQQGEDVNLKTDTNPQTEDSNEYDKIWNSDKSPEELISEVGSNENNEEQNTQQEELKQEESKEQQWSLTITRPLIYRGKEIYPQTEDELITLAQKGLDYNLKMSKIAPYRKLIDAIEAVGSDKIETFINALKGDTDAKQQIKQILGINETEDFFDDDKNENKNSSDIQRHKNEVEQIFQQILKENRELAFKIKDVYDSLDNTFKAELNNPEAFKAFAGLIYNNLFDKLYPIAIRIKAQNPYYSWMKAFYEAHTNSNKKPKEPEQELNTKPEKRQVRQKTIEEKYDEIWQKEHTIEELEKILIEGV
jgi:hypothetical protein